MKLGRDRPEPSPEGESVGSRPPLTGGKAAAGPGRPGAGRKTGTMQVLRDGLGAIGPDRPRLALASALALLTGVIETVLLYLVARVAVALTAGDTSASISVGPLHPGDLSINGVVLVSIALLALAIGISIPLAHLLSTLSSRAIVRMRNSLISGYVESSWAYRSKHREGYLQELIGDYSQRAETAVQQFATAVVALCTLSMLCVGAVLSNPLASIGAVIGLALTALILRPMSSKVKRSSIRNASINSEVVGRAAQTARLSEEIAAFDVGPQVAEHLSGDVVEASQALWRVRYTQRLVPTLYQYGALGVVLTLIGLLSVFQPDGLASVAPLVLLMVRALTYVRQLLTATQASGELAPYLESVEMELATLAANREPPATVDLQRFERMELDHVSFEYNPGRPVLTDVSFVIEPGVVLGIAGASGGGKTTLTQLLLRLRQPTSGRIIVGRHDLAAVMPQAWSRVASFVPQENKLIYATVADNIRFYRGGFDLDDVERAARAAHLHDEILGLPEGYQTLLGPGARNLSGGQRQRLGIARALLGGPTLLVLDEPTSALDAISEQLIRDTLEEARGSMTIVLVAHRPATLQICDRVLRVDEGRAHIEDLHSASPRPAAS